MLKALLGIAGAIINLLALPDVADCRGSKCDSEEDRRYFIRGVDVKASLNWSVSIKQQCCEWEFQNITGLSVFHLEHYAEKKCENIDIKWQGDDMVRTGFSTKLERK